MMSAVSLVDQDINALEADREADQHFLSFQIGVDRDGSPVNGLLSTRCLSEVLTLNTEVMVPIAGVPAAVMGVCNWRGEVLWLVDLGSVLQMPPIVYQHNAFAPFSVIVLNHTTGPIGLVVELVQDMVWLNPADIQGNAVSNPCIKGCWSGPDGDQWLEINFETVMKLLHS
jgi:positive phototaxis protein PixI